MTNPVAIALIKKHEGLMLMPYKDTVGKLTIGYGHNLSDIGISHNMAEVLLAEDIANAEKDARNLSHGFFDKLSENRQAVLIDMAFNLGRDRLSAFHKMWVAIEGRLFNEAADEMLDSVWAKQVGIRAKELAILMRNG